jgi:hypothetical protein
MTHRRIAAVALASSFCVPLIACGDPAETVEGIQMLAWSEDLRIGSIDEVEYAFTYITNVSVGPDDRIYVAQWQVPEVWIFEADGAPAGKLGGGGAGPGEFGGIGSVGWIGDTLWVSDVSSAISFFDRERRYLDRLHFSAPFPAGGSGFRPSRPLADGTILGTPSYSTDAVLRRGLDRVPYVRFDREGTALDTLARRALRREVLEIRLVYVATHPHGSELTVVDPEPDDVEGGFRLGRISIDGDTLLWRAIPYEPIPLTDAAIGQIIADSYEASDWLHDRLTGPAYEEAYLEGLDAPDAFPPVSRVLVDGDGASWIRREAVPGDSIRWEVYAPDGELRGELVLPSRFRVTAVRESALWAVDTDELDVQYLVRLNVEPAGPGS